MTSFKSQGDQLTAVPGEEYSFEGAVLRAHTVPPTTNSKEVATTEWVNNLLGITPNPPAVMDAGGLNISYTSGTVVNPLTSSPIHVTGTVQPIAVTDSSIEYVWVRYLDEAVIASSTIPNNNQGYLLATVTTNASSIVGIEANTNAAGWAPIYSPSFSGVVTAPTPPMTDNSNKVATTSWVRGVVQSTLAGSDFPTLSTNSAGNGIVWSSGTITVGGTQYPVLAGQYTFASSSTGLMKVYAVVVAATTLVVVSSITPSGLSVLLGSVEVSAGLVGQVNIPTTTGLAPSESPTFTGNPQVPTPSPNSKDNTIPTTEWVIDMITTKVGVGFGGQVTYIP